MPQMNGSGPDGKGPKTGRGLGNCNQDSSGDLLSKLGIGQGKRRKADGRPGEERKSRFGFFSFSKFLK